MANSFETPEAKAFYIEAENDPEADEERLKSYLRLYFTAPNSKTQRAFAIDMTIGENNFSPWLKDNTKRSPKYRRLAAALMKGIILVGVPLLKNNLNRVY